MFSGKKVRELLDASPYRSSDLGEFLCNNKKRSLGVLFSDDANPRADTIERLAAFFHVPIDELFVREDGLEFGRDNASLTQEVWCAQKAALVAEVEGLKKQVALLEEVRDGLKRELELTRMSACADEKIKEKKKAK